jgi:hypothetical protein
MPVLPFSCHSEKQFALTFEKDRKNAYARSIRRLACRRRVEMRKLSCTTVAGKDRQQILLLAKVGL